MLEPALYAQHELIPGSELNIVTRGVVLKDAKVGILCLLLHVLRAVSCQVTSHHAMMSAALDRVELSHQLRAGLRSASPNQLHRR